MVPMGMERLGFFRSPDMPTPERIPVTAGKKTAKTVQKSSAGGTLAGTDIPCGVPPAKKETRESTIAPMMKNCALSAALAETVARIASRASVTRPTSRGSHVPTIGRPDSTSASAKPAT